MREDNMKGKCEKWNPRSSLGLGSRNFKSELASDNIFEE